MHMSSQKLIYEVTVSVSSYRSFEAVWNTFQSVRWRQACKTCSLSRWSISFNRGSTSSLVHLIPTYRQKLKSAKPVVKTVKRWTNETCIRHVFSAYISLKFPLLGNFCERRFFLFEGHFLDIFQNYTFISPKCLIIQCILLFTIVQLLQKSLHTTQAWFHTGVHYLSICLPQTQHLSIVLISNPNTVTENAFSLWLFFRLQ